jgi:hypothetical protein
MHSVWQGASAIFAEASFAWTILFVVCFACLIAFVFDASIEIIFSILALGGFTAMAEHVMNRQYKP